MVPDLYLSTPPCPLCGVEVEAEPLGYFCEGCSIVWNSEGRRGERVDLEEGEAA